MGPREVLFLWPLVPCLLPYFWVVGREREVFYWENGGYSSVAEHWFVESVAGVRFSLATHKDRKKNMANLDSKKLKLAIQKEGRLTEETLEFLRKSGLEFESYKQRLFSVCRNFPLEILYVRDDDIPDYVASRTVDLGILGQNILNEERPKVKKLLNLRYGFCSLMVAVPKDSEVKGISDLKGKTIATSYPESAKKFFKENNIPIEVVKISGSVEIAPALGVAQAIVDLTSTGSTLALNDLRMLTKIYESESVLVANEKSLLNGRKTLVEKLLTRFKGVLSAKDYKYVMMNAP